MRVRFIRMAVLLGLGSLLVYTHGGSEIPAKLYSDFTSADRMARLDVIVPELSFNGDELAEVLRQLAENTGARFVADWNYLETAGIGREAPVTGSFRGVSLSTVLSVILDNVGGSVPLSYDVSPDGSIVIAVVNTASAGPVIARSYEVGDLANALYGPDDVAMDRYRLSRWRGPVQSLRRRVFHIPSVACGNIESLDGQCFAVGDYFLVFGAAVAQHRVESALYHLQEMAGGREKGKN